MRLPVQLSAIVCICLFATGAALAQRTNHQHTSAPTMVSGSGPTIVAFFPVTPAEADSDGDVSEAFSDFTFYAHKAAPRLKRAGIQFRVVNERSFQLRINGRVVVVRVGEDSGYCLIGPGKKPYIERGVMTDDDLVVEARKYFGIAIP